MSVKRKTRANQRSCRVTILSMQTINYGGKTKANLKPELKMKVV